jgi:hypothetical protein
MAGYLRYGECLNKLTSSFIVQFLLQPPPPPSILYPIVSLCRQLFIYAFSIISTKFGAAYLHDRVAAFFSELETTWLQEKEKGAAAAAVTPQQPQRPPQAPLPRLTEESVHLTAQSLANKRLEAAEKRLLQQVRFA